MASKESCSDEEGDENIWMERVSKTTDHDSLLTTTSHHCVANLENVCTDKLINKDLKFISIGSQTFSIECLKQSFPATSSKFTSCLLLC